MCTCLYKIDPSRHTLVSFSCPRVLGLRREDSRRLLLVCAVCFGKRLPSACVGFLCRWLHVHRNALPALASSQDVFAHLSSVRKSLRHRGRHERVEARDKRCWGFPAHAKACICTKTARPADHPVKEVWSALHTQRDLFLHADTNPPYRQLYIQLYTRMCTRVYIGKRVYTCLDQPGAQ